SKVTIGPIPAEGLDSGDKATNKALSAALKYALIQTFSIPTEDMAEGDAESPEKGVSIRSQVSASSSKEVSGDSHGTEKPESKVGGLTGGSKSFRRNKPTQQTGTTEEL